MTTDLATVSRANLRDLTGLQHPIFLYQIRTRLTDPDGEELAEDAVDDYHRANWEFRTDRVFATYKEAHAYGQSNRHNDGDEGKGWRVYAVAASGALRDLLERTMAP